MNPKDLETRNCKTPNCDREATALRGRYAGLCDHCRAEQTRTASESPAPARPQPVAGEPVSFAAKAKRLVKLGQKLDTAVARYKPAKKTLADAMAEWKTELRKLAGEDT